MKSYFREKLSSVMVLEDFTNFASRLASESL